MKKEERKLTDAQIREHLPAYMRDLIPRERAIADAAYKKGQEDTVEAVEGVENPYPATNHQWQYWNEARQTILKALKESK